MEFQVGTPALSVGHHDGLLFFLRDLHFFFFFTPAIPTRRVGGGPFAEHVDLLMMHGRQVNSPAGNPK